MNPYAAVVLAALVVFGGLSVWSVAVLVVEAVRRHG